MAQSSPTIPVSSFKTFAFSFALGLITLASFSWGFLFFLAILGFSGLAFLWSKSPGAKASAMMGFSFGFGQFLGGISWVYVSMHRFGGMPIWMALLCTVFFAAFLALFPALAGWLQHRLKYRGLFQGAIIAANWVLTELLRGWLFGGFPWLVMGYSQAPPSPLAGFAPVLGVYGVSFITVWLATSVILAWKKFWAPALVTLMVGFFLGLVNWTKPIGPPLTVSLLQGNIPQSLHWSEEGLRLSMERYLELTYKNPADLVVLPEAALPVSLELLPKNYLTALHTASGGNVILGVITKDDQGHYYNSAFSIQDGRTYHKQHLVPFGEFTPPLFAWVLAYLNIPMSALHSGPFKQIPLAVNDSPILVSICYEILFGEEIAWRLQSHEPHATILANITNTAWFGHSLAHSQLLQIERLRALELGRPLLAATNTGITAIVNHRGEVMAEMAAFEQGALTGNIQGRSGVTPYTLFRNIPMWLGCVFFLIFAGARLLCIHRLSASSGRLSS